MRKRKKSTLLEDKLIYTYVIVLAYMIGRSIPLYGVDVSNLVVQEMDAQTILTQTVSGDLNQCSILALGIVPYMTASILVSMIAACRSSESKTRTSSITMNRITVLLMFVFASLLAASRLNALPFTATGYDLIMQKVISSVQMVTGAFVIMWMARRNKKYGIGGQTILIYVNVLDSIRMNLSKQTFDEAWPVMAVALLGVLIITFMDNTEKRIPVQRISIHNIYSDKNYYAIKLLPVGIMPIMFATSFYTLVSLIVSLLLKVFPQNTNLLWFQSNNELSKPLGIIVYLFVLVFLTVIFALLFINPSDAAEQFMKNGDSIVNLHSGAETKWYLIRSLIGISLISAAVMCVCVGTPMMLQLLGKYDNSLVMLPTSVMMLTGIWTNIQQEIDSVKNLDSYEKFIKVI